MSEIYTKFQKNRTKKSNFETPAKIVVGPLENFRLLGMISMGL